MNSDWIIEKHTEPFEWMTIDNYLPEQQFDELVKYCNDNVHLYTRHPMERKGKVTHRVGMGLEHRRGPEAFQEYSGDWQDIAINNFAMDEGFMREHFEHHRQFEDPLVAVHAINNTRPTHVHSMHCESPRKVLSNILYVLPEQSFGTLLYDRNQEFVCEVEWKPNRSLVMCGMDDVTWHNYKSTDDYHRFTLASFLMRSDKDIEKYGG